MNEIAIAILWVVCGLLLIMAIPLLVYKYSCKKCGRLQERGWVINVDGKRKRYWNCKWCDGPTQKP